MTRQLVEPEFPSPSGSPTPTTLILVVEDEVAQRDTLVDALTARGYRVETAANGLTALEMVKFLVPDVVLLDLGLPDIDGIELCRHLRVQLSCPLIVVTADAMEDRIVEALDLGADDYIVKPFKMHEFLARVRVALRHRVTAAPLLTDELLESGDLLVDVVARQVRIGDEIVDLAPRHFDLLTALVRNEGRVMTYETLARVVWGLDAPSDPRFPLRTAISKVRKILGVGRRRPSIETEHHVGYRLLPPSE